MTREVSADSEELSRAEALRRYVASLLEESWCVDLSAWPLKGLHAISDRNCATQAFALRFRKWAFENRVHVTRSEYPAFRKSLEDDVIERLPHVYGSSFRPTGERFFTSRGALLANTYIPPTHATPSEPGTPALLLEYLNRLCPDETERRHVVQFLAHIVQFPQERPQFGLIITGDPGCGKSSLVRLMRAALCGRNVWHENSYAPVFKQFSEVLPNNLVVCIDDAPDGKDTYERLKHATTSDLQEVEVKGQQKTVLREVYARIIILSNSTRPVKLGADDRRFYVPSRCTHRDGREERREFFARFNAWLELPTTPAVLFHWLKAVSLQGFSVGSTVQTETHAQMVDESVSTLERLVLSFVEEEPIFHEGELLAFLKGSGITSPRPDEVARKLAGVGYRRKRRCVQGCANGKQIPLWTPSCKRARELTAAEEQAIKSHAGRSL